MIDQDGHSDRLSDTEVNAYLDGELDAPALAEIEAWLADHPDDATRVHGYKLQRLQLHQLYDLAPEAPLPESLRNVLNASRTTRWLPSWRQLAAGIMLLALGGASGWFGDRLIASPPPATSASIVQRALNAYYVYAYESARPVEIGVQEDNDLVSWLSGRLGQSVRTPDLEAVGFTLIGGRLANDQGEPAALFLYEDDSSQRLALYVRRSRALNDRNKVQVVSGTQTTTLYWTDDALDYALAGEVSRIDLKKLTQTLLQDIEARAAT